MSKKLIFMLQFFCLKLLVATSVNNISLEFLQTLFGRSSLGYQRLLDQQTSVELRGEFHNTLTNFLLLLDEQYPYSEFKFGLSLSFSHWFNLQFKDAFFGIKFLSLYQLYQNNQSADQQGSALLLGNALFTGYRWFLTHFLSLTANIELGIDFPFAIETTLPPLLNRAQPYAAIGLSLAFHW